MLSPQLKRQVFELWNMFWTSGMTNPLTAIEQITYLLFIKRLESLDITRREKGLRSIYGRRRNCQLSHLHSDDEAHIEKSIPEGANPVDYCIGHGTCRWSYISNVNDKITVELDADPNFAKQNKIFRTKFLHKYSESGEPLPPHELDESERKVFYPTKDITQHEHLSQYVFPWLRELEHTLQEMGGNENALQGTSQHLQDAYFDLPPTKTATLKSAITKIDELFKTVDGRGTNAHIIGDIYEYLLSEIETSGKNGPFRTPRHIIRFMIELLDPKLGDAIIDPAAGTCGFLINSIEHLRKKQTASETMLLEWDGTLHGSDGDLLTSDSYLDSRYFTGYDNDRTMVRIGWMNMILHGIQSPTVKQRDSLGKNSDYDDTGKYDLGLANPPFMGTVDVSNLHTSRFPRNPKNLKEPITNKSELLFIWAMLDLLKSEGRAAVIVPEGVLSGSTGAHKELRRQLLLENLLEAVISLPAGVFQPYTGAKTSILVFQKIGSDWQRTEKPRTKNVWFYEVAADGYTLDAKRSDKPEPNDLWDALAKWKDKIVDSTDYYQPQIYEVRWRVVDDRLINIFPDLAPEKDKVLDIHELFKELPANPIDAAAKIIAEANKPIRQLHWEYLAANEPDLLNEDRSSQKIQERLQKQLQGLTRRFDESMKQMLETEYEKFGYTALQNLMEAAHNEVLTRMASQATDVIARSATQPDWQSKIEEIVREFAKLDGYNVKLRSPEISKQEQPLSEAKSWHAPVRVLVRNEEWTNEDETIKGTHGEQGEVRREFLTDPRIYNRDGSIKNEYLEPGCIEANDFNLSATRYKPFTMTAAPYEPPADIIRALQQLEGKIQDGLSNLLSMVEGAK